MLLSKERVAVVAATCVAIACVHGRSESEELVRSVHADTEWKLLETLMAPEDEVLQGEIGVPPEVLGAYSRWIEANNRLLRELGMAFYKTHQDDPRRWQWLAATVSQKHAVRYYSQLGADFDATGVKHRAIPIDAAGEQLWERTLKRLRNECYSASDASDAVKAQVLFAELFMPMWHELRSMKLTEDQLLSAAKAWEAKIIEAGEIAPTADDASFRAMPALLLGFYSNGEREQQKLEFIGKLKGSSNVMYRKLANGADYVASLRTRPIELKFTAIDGREVDFSQLRGKVVLLDFWATGCHPCLAEVQNLRTVYEKYRQRGFEIVGVACEMSERDRENVLLHMEKESVSWPQYFGTRGLQNDIASRFSVTGLPSHFLFDQDGLLIEQWRGGPTAVEQLEDLIRGALGPRTRDPMRSPYP